MESLGNNFDYMEVIFVKGSTPFGVTYDIQEDEFNMYLSKMRQYQQYKFFQVDTKEYYHRNLVLIKKIKDGTIEETKVYQQTPLHVIDLNHFRVVSFEKKKLSTIAFPSSKTYDDIKHKRKLIFRVNNKIYINFQQELDGSNKMSRKVYINFNNNKDTDVKDSVSTIKHLMQDIFRGMEAIS